MHLTSYFADVSGNGRINASEAAQVARNRALIHISEPTRLRRTSYAAFCLKKKNKKQKKNTYAFV